MGTCLHGEKDWCYQCWNERKYGFGAELGKPKLLKYEIITIKKQLELIASIHKEYILKDFENASEEMEYLRVHLSSASLIAEHTLKGIL